MGRAADSMGTLGILGGGQLARMTALAARSLGYRVHALDPSPHCPAAPVVDRLIVAPFHDEERALELARGCDVVTLDLEHVPARVLDRIEQHCPVRPGARTLELVQDRALQKGWLASQGFPVGPHAIVDGEAELGAAITRMHGDVFVKARAGGFDGRGQRRVSAASEAASALSELRTTQVVAEQALDLACELSVLVARRPGGECAVYPPALNQHRDGILDWTLLPGPLPPGVSERAQQLALSVVNALGVVGVCVTEMFLTSDGTLLVNELAPRPHNSYHGSERACETSQFAQHVRAVVDLPLGSTAPVRATAMANLLGDLWLGTTPPDLRAVFEIPGVSAELYGKSTPARGRKMGHLTATGTTPEQALERMQAAKAAMLSSTDQPAVAP